jgi:basic membrane protein A
VPGEEYKVGLLVFMLGDRSYWDSAARGIQWANERLPNIDGHVFEHQDESEMELTARALAEEGYDMVISMGWGAAEWVIPIAEQYPDTHFYIPGGEPAVMANTSGGDFKEHEGCFTVGMIAAMLTKTDKVGFVGGWDSPLIWRFLVGYEEGLKYVNPDIEVTVAWANDYQNPSKGKELALTQYAEGCDIIFAAAGKTGEGVLAAAAEQGKLAIGVDSDQDWIQPGNVLTSMLKNVDMVIFNKITELSQGNVQSGNEHYGLAEGLVGSTWLYYDNPTFRENGPADLVAQMPEVIAKVEDAVAKIKAGEFCVTDYMEVFPCDNPAPAGGMGM